MNVLIHLCFVSFRFSIVMSKCASFGTSSFNVMSIEDILVITIDESTSSISVSRLLSSLIDYTFTVVSLVNSPSDNGRAF
jgi:hypothetical protein